MMGVLLFCLFLFFSLYLYNNLIDTFPKHYIYHVHLKSVRGRF